MAEPQTPGRGSAEAPAPVSGAAGSSRRSESRGASAEREHEVSPEANLTHLDDRGHARMVDVGDKPATAREAVASALVRLQPETARRLSSGTLPKGDALAVARVAGIMAAKQTPQLIPLCHVVALAGVAVDVEVSSDPPAARVVARVRAADRTGVEMEALVAASTAALALYDMIKAIDRGAVIEHVRLERKTGGVRGDWERDGTDG